MLFRAFRTEALLLLVHFAVIAWILATSRIPTSADQAIVGLMGIHILEGRGHPVFYFGATYAGSFEAHLIAVAFKLFGVSTGTYRGVTVLLTTAIVVSVWVLARRLYGAKAARWTLAYLALPPYFFLYKTLTSDGWYATACLLASGTILSALWYCGRSSRNQASLAPAASLGFLGGLGFWIGPLCPPFFVATLTWIAAMKWPRVRGRRVAALALAFIAGSAPWWIWNARHGWASLTSPETALGSMRGAPGHLVLAVTQSIPILLGVGIPNAPPEGVPARVAVLLAGCVIVALSLTRARGEDSATGLLLWVLLVIVLVGTLPSRFAPLEPRFLVCAYVLFAPLVGATAADARLAARTFWDRLRRATGLGAVVCLLLANVASLPAARVHASVVDEKQVTAPIDGLLGVLRERGIRHAWASYWTAYRVAFESREEVLATPLRGEDLVRIDQYEEAVSAARRPAVILLPPTAGCFEEYLRERHATFRLDRSGAFRVFSDLDQETLAILRGARSLPLPSSGHQVAWKVLRHPVRFEAGSLVSVGLEARNSGACAWSHAVHVGHWWMPTGSPSEAREEPDRYLPNRRIGPGESIRAEFDVRAPAAPGRWTVRYDLVQEGITWFRDAGGTPLVIDVEVTKETR